MNNLQLNKTRRNRIGRAGLTLAALAGLLGISACQPPPPRLQLSADAAAAGPDHAPGDGVCEVNAGVGDCSLQAAVDEANAHGPTDIAVGAGTYDGLDLTVTGDARIEASASGSAVLGGTVDIATGANLAVVGIRQPTDQGEGLSDPLFVTVSGTLHLTRSFVVGVDPGDYSGTAVTIATGGVVVMNESAVLGGDVAVDNGGTLLARQSSLASLNTYRLYTAPGARSYLQGTLLTRGVNTSRPTSSCLGDLPISLGYNAAQEQVPPGCGLNQPTDQTFFTSILWGNSGPETSAGWSGIDAIPVGEIGCEVTGTDIDGHPRAVDGNGDSILGCDIGARELQP